MKVNGRVTSTPEFFTIIKYSERWHWHMDVVSVKSTL